MCSNSYLIMENSFNVNVSIEANTGPRIQEITYDEQEIFQPPCSMSDELSSRIRGIDFFESRFENPEPESEASSYSIWSDLQKKIRDTTTEIGVLLDMLKIALGNRYLTLSPVPQEPFESNLLAVMYSRKKGLSQAATMLLSAADRDINSHKEMSDFYDELLKLRQHWRLEKISSIISGDLSYRTAGSRFKHTGVFKITKADADENVNSSNSQTISPIDVGGVNPHATLLNQPASLLNLTVPTELKGVACIMVCCQTENEVMFNTPFSVLGSSPNASSRDFHWQQKLEAAQNVLFCKELFSQLAREAVQSARLQTSVPHVVFGNQIIVTVLPGIQLKIYLCRNFGNESKCENISSVSNNDYVLEHSLHQLLAEMHYKNIHYPFPHPSSAPFEPSKRKYLSGSIASDRYDVMEMNKSFTLLEQIIEQARYFFLRLKVEYVLDTISKELKDPLIVPHWNSLNLPTPACVKIAIVSHGYDTSFSLQILRNGFKCICNEGKVTSLSYELEELKDFIAAQVHSHRIAGIQNMAKNMGWQLLMNSPYFGLGPVKPYRGTSSTILSSPIGDRFISIQCESYGKVEVSVAHGSRDDFIRSQLAIDRKWENLAGQFKEVCWEKMQGKNFLNKMELLMASLTSSS